MNRIDIPEDQIVPLDSVAPGIHGLRITFANVFGVTRADGSWTVIDTSLPFTDTIVQKWVEKTFQHSAERHPLQPRTFRSCVRSLRACALLSHACLHACLGGGTPHFER
jgi:hypothetical protein